MIQCVVYIFKGLYRSLSLGNQDKFKFKQTNKQCVRTDLILTLTQHNRFAHSQIRNE